MREIEDMTTAADTGLFWNVAAELVESAEVLVQLRLKPKHDCGLVQRLCESRRMWELIQRLRKYGYRPMPGDEIMARGDDNMKPHNGSHRAAALRALNQPVPVLVVHNWRADLNRRPVKWQPLDS